MPRTKKPWPTKDAMTQIYEKNLWGGDDHDFYSGSGSHDPKYVVPYVNKVKAFLCSFEEAISVCDLGCGDFNVGKQLASHSRRYDGVDIVQELIARNQNRYGSDKVRFHCRDIAKDPLPEADCVILRNVLQHISNNEIKALIPKLRQYSYLIISEHLPNGEYVPNLDIISGQGIRLKKNSGVDITAPPFNFKTEYSEEWLSIPYEDGKGLIKTILYV